MKKLTLVIPLIMLALSVSMDVLAWWPARYHPGGDGPVGAPLDGGLLAILGAAGVAYYVARKRKARK